MKAAGGNAVALSILLKYLWAKPFRWRVVLHWLLGLTNGGAQVAYAILLGKIFAGLTFYDADNIDWIWALIGLSLALWALSGFCTYWESVNAAVLREQVMLRLGRGHLDRVLAGYEAADETRTGQVLNRYYEDVQALSELLIVATGFLRPFVLTIASIWITAALNPIIPVVVAAIIPLYWFISSRISKQSSSKYFEASEKTGDASSFLFEILQGIEVLRAFDGVGRRSAAYSQLVVRKMRAMLHASRLSAILTTMTLSSQGLLSLLILVFATITLASARVPLADLVTVNAMIMYLWGSAQTLLGSIVNLHRIQPNLHRIQHTIKRSFERQPLQDMLSNPRGRIEVVAVNHRYRAGNVDALMDINLVIDHGEKVVFLGPNGAGKSTLLKIVGGLIEPTRGTVMIGGEDIAACRTLYPSLCFVPQDPFLFNQSIIQNVRMGKPNASDREIERCLDLVGLSDNEVSFSREVGERGTSLSGGQRQRVALARALICEPDSLLLDEPASSIDKQSVEAIYRALSEYSGTVIVVSHDLQIHQAGFSRTIVFSEGMISDGPVKANTPVSGTRRIG